MNSTPAATATYVAHVNAWQILLRDSMLGEPGIKDVTEQLRAAQAPLWSGAGSAEFG